MNRSSGLGRRQVPGPREQELCKSAQHFRKLTESAVVLKRLISIAAAPMQDSLRGRAMLTHVAVA